MKHYKIKPHICSIYLPSSLAMMYKLSLDKWIPFGLENFIHLSRFEVINKMSYYVGNGKNYSFEGVFHSSNIHLWGSAAYCNQLVANELPICQLRHKSIFEILLKWISKVRQVMSDHTLKILINIPYRRSYTKVITLILNKVKGNSILRHKIRVCCIISIKKGTRWIYWWLKREHNRVL